MNLSRLTKIFKKYLRIFHYGERIRPRRDWLLIIGISSILLIGSAGWSYWLFEQISGAGGTNGTVAPLPAVSAASLDSVRALFEKRAAEKAHYLSDYHFVDPSG